MRLYQPEPEDAEGQRGQHQMARRCRSRRSGTSRACTAKTYSSSRPTTNCGAETATKLVTIRPLSSARPAPQRRDDADGQADHQLADDAAGHQQQRRRQPRRDQAGDLGLLQVAAAHVAVEQPAQVTQVLHQQRPVEAQLVPDVLDRLLRGRAAGDLPHRVGGQHVKQQEGDEADPQKDQRGLHQATDQIGIMHAPLPRAPAQTLFPASAISRAPAASGPARRAARRRPG